MEHNWIPIIGSLFGTLFTVAVVAIALHFRLQQKRMEVEAEIQRMEMAWQRARQSFSKG